MKIFNYTKILVNRQLWHFISNELCINRAIRDAALFDRYELSVVIKPRPACVDKHYYGSYYPGRLDILTCSDCTPGTILHTFIHEALHAYLYQLGDDYYFTINEETIDKWATTLYLVAGGSISDRLGCGRYILKEASKWNGNLLRESIANTKTAVLRVSRA